VVTFRAHQLIQKAGDAPTRAYTVYSGWAYRAVHFQDGRRQILSFLLPGDMINIGAIWIEDYKIPFNVRALTDVTLCAFSADDMRRVINSSDAQQSLFAAHIQRQFALAERRLVDVGQRLATARIARLVLDLDATLRARGLSTGDTIEFPLRQEDIADALGLTTAHVNRTLFKLRRRGLLDLKQGQARILDRTQLQIVGANE
jgi:CRP-like cAMP-binding protein